MIEAVRWRLFLKPSDRHPILSRVHLTGDGTETLCKQPLTGKTEVSRQSFPLDREHIGKVCTTCARRYNSSHGSNTENGENPADSRSAI